MTAFLTIFLMLLTGLQGLLMAVDEWVFHRRRGLPVFERWGHVADTGLFFLALACPAWLEPSSGMLILYGFLATASCLLITKDEWVHAQSCSGAEQWCHALLFVLHGTILLTAGLLWFLQPQSRVLQGLPCIILGWGVYQHLYWNIYYERKQHKTGREQSLLRRAGRALVQR